MNRSFQDHSVKCLQRQEYIQPFSIQFEDYYDYKNKLHIRIELA